MKTDWLALGEAGLPEVVALRRAIHAEPEIGLHTPLTAAKARAALDGLPLEIHEGTRTTGFVAVLRGGAHTHNARTVLLRGDMDALPMTEETGLPFASRTPGAMHACGHDAHTAMLAGAARVLSARRDELPGTVVFMFQPGEENYHGAREMIADGLLDVAPADAAFALHISPNLPSGVVAGRPGPLLASTDTIRITVKGQGGHAAMPHEALDPVPVACEIVTALQVFVARRISVFDPAVVTIARIAAGDAHNVIPGHAELLGTLRAQSAATREAARAGVRRVAENIAAAHGMTAEVDLEPGYPVTLNDPRAAAAMRDAARALGGDAGWLDMPAPIMGGEDFSYVLERTPGAMSFLGVATGTGDPRLNPPLHNTRMTVDEAALAKGVAMHCALAERFLSEGWSLAARASTGSA